MAKIGLRIDRKIYDANKAKYIAKGEKNNQKNVSRNQDNLAYLTEHGVKQILKNTHKVDEKTKKEIFKLESPSEAVARHKREISTP